MKAPLKKILVTGCGGFLAGHIYRRLDEKSGWRLFGIGDTPCPDPRVRRRQVDLRRPAQVRRAIAAIRPDLTIHLAAVSNVGFSWKNPRLTYEVNFMGTVHLLEALSDLAPGGRVLLASSAEVYAEQGAVPLNENSPLDSGNPYALSKTAMEKAGAFFSKSRGLEVITVRPFNFTGPGQTRSFVAPDFAAQVAECEAGRREKLIRVGNLAAVRDFSDVRDIADKILIAALEAKSGEIFNLCSGRGLAIREILDILLAQARTTIEVEVEESRFRPLDRPVIIGDGGLFEQRFGAGQLIPLEKTLADLLDEQRRAICQTV